MQSPITARAVAAPLGDDPSRRRFLAAGSAATVFASLRSAIAQAEGGNVRDVVAFESDPVFAAIAAWESAMAAVDAARDDDAAWTARVREWFARAGDVFRSEPRTQAGALALLSFVGENINLYNDGKEEGPGAILRSVAVLNAWTNSNH
ncbi:MAG: hypothetical protein ACLPSW_02515 [Roseiarcus sp.]